MAVEFGAAVLAYVLFRVVRVVVVVRFVDQLVVGMLVHILLILLIDRRNLTR